jgi:hypothetical protein
MMAGGGRSIGHASRNAPYIDHILGPTIVPHRGHRILNFSAFLRAKNYSIFISLPFIRVIKIVASKVVSLFPCSSHERTKILAKE